MGRAPCCSKVGMHRGPWTPREDALLTNYIQSHGEGNWRNLPQNAGLLRCGKSCRLRWMNYLRPDIKRGNIGPEEEDLIVRLHKLLGNRWSLIAGRLPGRTDNEIKNYWNSHLSKRLKRQGLELREGSSKVTSKRGQQTQKSDGNKKKQDKRKKKAGLTDVIEETQTRTEIYVPKPRRFTSILRRSNVMETSDVSDFKIGSTSSDDQKGDASEGNVEIGDIDWSDVNDGSFFIDHGFSCELPSEDHSLERLYQEYSQLLNSEDDQFRMIPFIEPLFI